MQSLNPPLSKNDFINSPWQDVVNNSERKERFAYNMAFWEKAKEAKEAGKVREQAVFEILAFITGAAIKSESTDEFFAEVFQNLTDEHLNFLAEIATEISDPELQARVADILWVKRRDYKMAQLAVDAYLKSAKELEDPEKWVCCYQRIERALRLAYRIGYQPDVVISHIEEVLDRYQGQDPWLLSLKLMELLQDCKLGEPQKYAALAETAAKLAESTRDWDRARNYWKIKQKWHLMEKDEEQERAAAMLAAETYVKEAEDALKQKSIPYVTASHHLQQALEAFRRIRGTKEETANAKTRAEEVHKLMIQYQKQSQKEFITISDEADISKYVEQAREYVRGKEFPDALLCLALLVAPTKVSQLRQGVQDVTLFSAFSSMVIQNEVGKVVARQTSNSDEAEKATCFEMYTNAMRYQECKAQALIEPARYQIYLEHSYIIKDIQKIIFYSPFVPPNREYLFAKGLYAGLAGDFFTSTHILIPQIENSVRYLLSQRGVITSGLDDNGIQNEHNLNSTLYRPEINSIFDEDTLFDLKGLLVERSGSNLRNRMAHGLIDDSGFLKPIMSYLWCIALRLCLVPILQYQQQVEESDPWVKFAGMFKDDPLFDEFVEDMAAYRRELDAEIGGDEETSEENQSA
jgi:hypothetical protein